MTGSLLVQTAYGPVMGTRDGNISAWLGVPFAAPPVGPLRFRAPQPPQPWTEVRAATAFGPASIQTPLVLPGAPPLAPSTLSEDCLYLNIWSPAADGQRRPVLFWIHGGAFSTGTGAAYVGSELAELGDIVVVSINYRLGILGFANFGGLFGDERFGHNLGLLDQLQALKWVRENIAAFGGDPERITIAGESAGAGSVSLLMHSDAAIPFFHGAILESGAPNQVATWAHSLELARTCADLLGVTPENLDRLWTIPAEEILAAQNQAAARHPGTLIAVPYLDNRLLPATPEALFARPTPEIPMLIGSNRDEATLFALNPDRHILPVARSHLERLIRRALPTDQADAILRHYPDDRAGALALSRDYVFTMPLTLFAERHAAHAPTWVYRFDWPSPAFGGLLGATHALEMAFLWKSIERVLGPAFVGTMDAPLEALAGRMKRHWVSFVRNGRPEEDWLPFDLETRSTRIFHLTDEQVSDPERERREAWAGVTLVTG